MTRSADERTGGAEAFRTVLPDLTELCRIHDIGIDLIERSHDLDDLLDRVLEEYETRLAELPDGSLDERVQATDLPTAKKLRALVMFASQATALKAKSAESALIRQRASSLAEINAELEAALAEARTSRASLDGVLATLDAGILILGPDGRLQKTNRAASLLVTELQDQAPGKEAPSFLGQVPRGCDREVSVSTAAGERRLLMVARRDLDAGGHAEVVLLSDITQRSREIEERHRLEKLGDVLRTLSVLSHKINNPLTALLGRAQILQAHKGSDPRVAKAAEVIEDCAIRIADLIRELARVVKEGRQEAVEKILDMGVEQAAGETLS